MGLAAEVRPEKRDWDQNEGRYDEIRFDGGRLFKVRKPLEDQRTSEREENRRRESVDPSAMEEALDHIPRQNVSLDVHLAPRDRHRA